MEAQVGQFLVGCKCSVSRGIVVQEQEILVELPAAFFLQKSFNCKIPSIVKFSNLK
jgi:hypothetical protein